ncbi:MAG: hypothetical protein K2O45_00175 [Oscillospiraceae bacterium]|nr:hypothetical protein [Oscillospiraceae bacterium]
MSETQRVIESIIFSFKEEMSIIEQENIFAIISGDNRPTPQEMYARQKKIAQKYIQYENALRRILWCALGTVEKQKQMLSSAAEKA